jgi:hypothetical protein
VSSFNGDPEIDGLSKLIDDERDKIIGGVFDDTALLATEDVRPVRLGTRIRSIQKKIRILFFE